MTNINDAVTDSIEESIESEGEEKTHDTSFPDAIKALGEIGFNKYPLKLSNITEENAQGMAQIQVLNDYMLTNWGCKFTTLDILVKDRMERIVSVDGFGWNNLIQLVQSIQAQFSSMEGEGLVNRLKRKI